MHIYKQGCEQINKYFTLNNKNIETHTSLENHSSKENYINQYELASRR